MTVELITRYVKILIGFVLVWGGVWALNNFGCNRVAGPEMMPTIPQDKSTWIDPKTRHPDELKRDDIVAYAYDFGGRSGLRNVTARVMGLPGDRVKIVKGEVFINNSKAGGAADKKAATEDYAEIIVPRDTIFALCDNRSQRQFDSRTVGPIGTWAILGKLR